MIKIAVTMLKGGVAKTTTAVTLSHYLSRQDLRVLLVDSDTQPHCSRSLGIDDQDSLARLLLGDSEPTEAIVEARPGLWLLSGGPELARVKRHIAREDLRPEEFLSKGMKAYEGYFDFVIIDTGPGWDSLSVNVLIYADKVLCPVSLEVLSVDGLTGFTHNLEQIKEVKKDLQLDYILPTFMDGRVKKSAEILASLEQHFPGRLCKPIRYSARISESPSFGRTIWEMDSRNRAARDYADLGERIRSDGEKRTG